MITFSRAPCVAVAVAAAVAAAAAARVLAVNRHLETTPNRRI